MPHYRVLVVLQYEDPVSQPAQRMHEITPSLINVLVNVTNAAD